MMAARARRERSRPRPCRSQLPPADTAPASIGPHSIDADGRVARRSRRLGPGRLLRGRGPARRRDAGRGRHDRAPADAVGARPARRRARPPEDQVGLARLRADRRAARLPLPRQRRGRPRRLRTTSCSRSTTPSSTRSARRPTGGMGIPGEDLPGSWAATEFVAWYNGHPDFQELAFDLSGERAVVIGNGNVAVDVARMLALTPEELAPTDTTDAAIAAIAARRHPRDRHARPARPRAGGVHDARAEGARRARRRRRDRRPGRPRARRGERGALDATRTRERNLEVLREYAARTPEGKPKRLVLRFLASPVAILGEERVEARRARAQPARGRRERRAPRGADRRARDDPLRARLPQRRLPRRRASRACRSTRRAARSRTTRRPRRAPPASTARAGSSAARAASSARTRRTRRRRSSCCSRICRDGAAQGPLARTSSTRCSTSAACGSSSTRAGPRSTSSSAPPARSSAARA